MKNNKTTTIRVCGECAAGVANDDWSQMDAGFDLSNPEELADRDDKHASITASLELLGWLAYVGPGDAIGYFDCPLCTDTAIDGEIFESGTTNVR